MLLGDEWEGVGTEYGPPSQAVVSAMEVLGETVWFEQVGNRRRGLFLGSGYNEIG